MTKAALGMSAVIFPPFFCRVFESYGTHETSKINLYQMYNVVPSPSINLDKYQDGPTVFRREYAPFWLGSLRERVLSGIRGSFFNWGRWYFERLALPFWWQRGFG